MGFICLTGCCLKELAMEPIELPKGLLIAIQFLGALSMVFIPIIMSWLVVSRLNDIKSRLDGIESKLDGIESKL